MPTVQVNGGIITDEMLAGSLRFFKMSGPFANTIGTGNVKIPGTELYGAGSPLVVGDANTERPVPNSAADRAFEVLQRKCTIVHITVVDDNNIHFVCDGTAFGWQDANEMTTEINALGVVPVPDTSDTGTTADMSTVVITEAPNMTLA